MRPLRLCFVHSACQLTITSASSAGGCRRPRRATSRKLRAKGATKMSRLFRYELESKKPLRHRPIRHLYKNEIGCVGVRRDHAYAI